MVRPLHALEWVWAQQYQCKPPSVSHCLFSFYVFLYIFTFYQTSEHSDLPWSALEARHPPVQQRKRRLLWRLSKVIEKKNLCLLLSFHFCFCFHVSEKYWINGKRGIGMMTQEVQILKSNYFHFSSLIVYSDGTVEQIPPGIFQSTCKVRRWNRTDIPCIGGHDLVSLWWADMRPQVWHLDQPWEPGDIDKQPTWFFIFIGWYIEISINKIPTLICSFSRWTWPWMMATGEQCTVGKQTPPLSVRMQSGILSGGFQLDLYLRLSSNIWFFLATSLPFINFHERQIVKFELQNITKYSLQCI